MSVMRMLAYFRSLANYAGLGGARGHCTGKVSDRSPAARWRCDGGGHMPVLQRYEWAAWCDLVAIYSQRL